MLGRRLVAYTAVAETTITELIPCYWCRSHSRFRRLGKWHGVRPVHKNLERQVQRQVGGGLVVTLCGTVPDFSGTISKMDCRNAAVIMIDRLQQSASKEKNDVLSWVLGESLKSGDFHYYCCAEDHCNL